MVHNGKENCPTRIMHDSFDAAAAEAKRLSTANPGHAFGVLEMIGYFEVKFPDPQFSFPGAE